MSPPQCPLSLTLPNAREPRLRIRVVVIHDFISPWSSVKTGIDGIEREIKWIRTTITEIKTINEKVLDVLKKIMAVLKQNAPEDQGEQNEQAPVNENESAESDAAGENVAEDGGPDE